MRDTGERVVLMGKWWQGVLFIGERFFPDWRKELANRAQYGQNINYLIVWLFCGGSSWSRSGLDHLGGSVKVWFTKNMRIGMKQHEKVYIPFRV